MLINIFDVGTIAEHAAKQLERAGHTVRIHNPREKRNPLYTYHDEADPAYIIGDDVNHGPWIESELTAALQKNRALWLVSSVSASVIGRDMLDLCGNSGNIIFCPPPLYNADKVIGSTLTIARTKSAQQISRIRGRDNSRVYCELEANDELILLCRRALRDSHHRDNARIKFKAAIADGAYLASSVLVAYADFFGFTRPQRPDYVQLVEDFIKE